MSTYQIGDRVEVDFSELGGNSAGFAGLPSGDPPEWIPAIVQAVDEPIEMNDQGVARYTVIIPFILGGKRNVTAVAVREAHLRPAAPSRGERPAGG